MVKIYEATENDYPKIVSFMLSQPADSPSRKCFRLIEKTEPSITFLKKLKASSLGRSTFICEDDDGNIRIIYSRDARGFIEGEQKQVTGNFLFISNQDLKNENTEFLKQLFDFLIKDAYQNKGIIHANIVLGTVGIKLATQIFGDALIVKFKQPHPTYPELGEIWFVTIDSLKYLGIGELSDEFKPHVNTEGKST